MSTDDLTLGQLRHLVALADSSERPKPDVINPPDHHMAGHEWRITGEAPFSTRPPLWLVRTVDDPRLNRIADAHSKSTGAGGTTDGLCTECELPHPCPTYTWATTDRDPLATWDPADDETDGGEQR